jgi:hypothetical protein
MSVPKQLAKRMRMERKPLRMRERRLARKKTGATSFCGIDFFDLPGVVSGPVGGVKMSDVLNEFVFPVLKSSFDRDALLQLYSVAQTAWNIALEPQRRHETMIDETLDERLVDPTPLQREACREMLSWLVTRKLEHFADYQRPILSFQLDELDDGGYYLSVVSGLYR